VFLIIAFLVWNSWSNPAVEQLVQNNDPIIPPVAINNGPQGKNLEVIAQDDKAKEIPKMVVEAKKDEELPVSKRKEETKKVISDTNLAAEKALQDWSKIWPIFMKAKAEKNFDPEKPTPNYSAGKIATSRTLSAMKAALVSPDLDSSLRDKVIQTIKTIEEQQEFRLP
jgi:hypothetical protein